MIICSIKDNKLMQLIYKIYLYMFQRIPESESIILLLILINFPSYLANSCMQSNPISQRIVV